MPPPSPLHRHQSSLESVIDFSTEPPFRTDQRTEAKRRFYRVVEHFESADNSSSSRSRYDRPRLVRFTYELAVSDESRDNFLRAFFRAVALSIEGEEYIDFEKLRSAFFGFADHLLDNFFLPRKAGWVGYPFVPPLLMSLSEGFHQKDPAALTRIPLCSGGGAEGAQGFVGTPDRVSALRGACLVRDRHRCVISRRFDYNEAIRRLSGSSDARDDDGSLLLEDEKPFESLEVAHVLPHSLTKLDANSQLPHLRS
ncbi:hypothetical protein BDY21DRAFT_45863 [Lineolata rhizophorae]|uniref:HNH nuclease domain-containing protein n=1 Tax=Lineolata rhizophorae TaxID=578093 RepID=A0A6A6NYZ8_9PEZI|nr:hypothetical protein BDY21DRAFT_45863 [Lineolata rhizophorae]